jgi:hypothetical protein
MNKDKSYKEKYPSICYACDLARKPASDENRDNGYVGCCLRVMGKDWTEIIEGKEVAEGWVDLRASIDEIKGSGIITNLQLLTKQISACDSLTKKI